MRHRRFVETPQAPIKTTDRRVKHVRYLPQGYTQKGSCGKSGTDTVSADFFRELIVSVPVYSDFQSAGVGLQVGGGIMMNTVATGTIGFSGVNGEGVPFISDTPQTRRSGEPNGEAARHPERYEEEPR